MPETFCNVAKSGRKIKIKLLSLILINEVTIVLWRYIYIYIFSPWKELEEVVEKKYVEERDKICPF